MLFWLIVATGFWSIDSHAMMNEKGEPSNYQTLASSNLQHEDPVMGTVVEIATITRESNISRNKKNENQQTPALHPQPRRAEEKSRIIQFLHSDPVAILAASQYFVARPLFLTFLTVAILSNSWETWKPVIIGGATFLAPWILAVQDSPRVKETETGAFAFTFSPIILIITIINTSSYGLSLVMQLEKWLLIFAGIGGFLCATYTGILIITNIISNRRN